MRGSALLFVVCACLTAAQAPEDPELARARMDLNRIRALVETGALPRVQLQKAEDAVADAQDAVTIHRSVYSQDLTEDQARQLVAAAQRRVERRQSAYDQMKGLVDAGAMPQQNLNDLQQDLDFARKDYELANQRADLAAQLAAMAEAEAARLPVTPEAPKVAERYDGNGVFTPEIFAHIESAFKERFGKTLPVSANGETAVHRALGFDHRGRVDVAIRPDQAEGVWLRDYLRTHHIPYFAFSQAVPGKATGAHIHLGPQSTRLPVTEAGG